MSKKTLLIDKTIRKCEFLHRCAGINIRTGPKTRLDTLKSRCVYIFNFIWLNIDVAGASIWFINGISNSVNFTELTYAAPCTILCFLGEIKSLYLIINEQNIHILIANLRNLEIEEEYRRRTPDVDEIIKTEHNFVTTVFNILNLFYCVVVVGFAISPFILMSVKYLSTNEIELLLPFPIVYPFNPYIIRYWPIAYARLVWSEVVVVVYICSADYLFYIFCTYIRIQFRLLKYYIERIPFKEGNRNVKIINREEIQKKVIKLIKWHQQLLHSSNILETIYTRSTLLNFVISSVLICLTGFNVVAITDVAFVVTFLSFLFMSLLQIFFLCFFGDLLMTSSVEVSDAIYNCRWYFADRSLLKYLQIMQIRAQTPCKLTASNFSEVNLKAFMKVLSTAWSYFALLQTLYGSQK